MDTHDIDTITDIITDAIDRGITTIYIDCDGQTWYYIPADRRVHVLVDLADIAYECRCAISDLDPDQIARDIRDAMDMAD